MTQSQVPETKNSYVIDQSIADDIKRAKEAQKRRLAAPEADISKSGGIRQKIEMEQLMTEANGKNWKKDWVAQYRDADKHIGDINDGWEPVLSKGMPAYVGKDPLMKLPRKVWLNDMKAISERDARRLEGPSENKVRNPEDVTESMTTEKISDV